MSSPLKFLCVLPNGREVREGNSVYRTNLNMHVTAEDVYTDSDGDQYLTFKEGGSAWIGNYKQPKSDREVFLR